MRLLALLLIIVAAQAQSQTFPVPIGPEHAMTPAGPVTAAPSQQQYARAASNGEVALVVWTDTRKGRPMLYGTRVDAGGNVLDPFGVALGEIPFAVTAYGVAWNGDNFVVVLGSTLIFVTPEMTIAGRKTLGLPSTYQLAATTTGPDLRFLFLEPNRATGNGAVVDGEGRVVANKALWTNTVSTYIGVISLAAGNDSGFLLLLDQRDLGGTRVAVLATRIDADGNEISSKPSGAPIEFGFDTVKGRGDGFLIAEASYANGGTITAYKLDTEGVYHGQRYAIDAGTSGAEAAFLYRPAIAAGNGRWLVAWLLRRVDSALEERVAELGDDGSVVSRRIEQVAGNATDVALASAGGQRLVFLSADLGARGDYDIYARTLSSTLIPGDSRRVTNSSAPYQANAEIAAGANGFAVIWLEGQHRYLRRFSLSGEPQDPAAVDLGPSFLENHRIVSDATGRTYMVGDGFTIRRLDALSGQWLDPEPVSVKLGVAGQLATNGTSALVAGIGACPQDITQRCLFTARVPFTTQPPEARIVSAPLPASSQGPPAIGSNGLDYLVVFTNTPVFTVCCTNQPWQLYAMRLRADGTALDALPLVLDNGKNFPDTPSISSAGGRYLVVWQEISRKLRGRRVTAEGAVLDGDAEGSGADIPFPSGNLLTRTARAEAIGGQLAILIGRTTIDAGFHPIDDIWEEITFTPDMDLATAAVLPRMLLFHSAFPGALNFAIAPRGTLLGVAYDHFGERDTADVSRVFFRLYGTAPHRRAAH